MRPTIHVWIYNHPFNGISDQVDFLVSTFSQHGYRVTVGRRPAITALNVVIENFTTLTRATLGTFCAETGKRVMVIMTEHIDFDGKAVRIHGDPLWSENDYMHPATQVDRLKNLVEALPLLRGFLVLGDLPELQGVSRLLPGLEVCRLPFPRLDRQPEAPLPDKAVDLVFTGVLTDHRLEVCARVRKSGFSLAYPTALVSRRRRDLLNQSAKVVLNVPQRPDWRWLSGMRIMAALRAGRASASLGGADGSRISACCPQLDMSDPQWTRILGAMLLDWNRAFSDAMTRYEQMATAFEAEVGFPHAMLAAWAMCENLRPGE